MTLLHCFGLYNSDCAQQPRVVTFWQSCVAKRTHAAFSPYFGKNPPKMGASTASAGSEDTISPHSSGAINPAVRGGYLPVVSTRGAGNTLCAGRRIPQIGLGDGAGMRFARSVLRSPCSVPAAGIPTRLASQAQSTGLPSCPSLVDLSDRPGSGGIARARPQTTGRSSLHCP